MQNRVRLTGADLSGQGMARPVLVHNPDHVANGMNP